MITFEQVGNRLVDTCGIVEISPHFSLKAVRVKVYSKRHPDIAGSMDCAFEFFFRDYKTLKFSFPRSNLDEYERVIEDILMRFTAEAI